MEGESGAVGPQPRDSERRVQLKPFVLIDHGLRQLAEISILTSPYDHDSEEKAISGTIWG